MINRIIVLSDSYRILFFSLLLCACSRQEKQQSSFDFNPPEVVEAKPYIVPQDKMAPPEITPAKEITNKAISKPRVISFHSNVFPAGKPKVVTAGAPKICVPGQTGFSLPEMVTAIDSPFAAGAPEVITAKDPQINANTPANFSSFKVQQGLKTNWIHPIIQDRAGNLWISSVEGGVSKYDGKSFTNYTMAQGLSSDIVLSLLEDNKGNIWLGTLHRGLNKFDGKSFSHYTVNRGFNTVECMLQDRKGNIWLGTDEGVIKYDRKKFTHYTVVQGLFNNHVHSIAEDSEGHIWLGTEGGLSEFDGKCFRNYTKTQGLSNSNVNCLLKDSKANLWISMVKGGVMKFDGRRFEHYSTEQGLSSNEVNCIREDRLGNIWFGTENRGVIRFDGTSFIQFTTEQGLNNNNVHSIMEDRTGNLWIGTGDGLSKYYGKQFTHYNSSMGFSPGVYFGLTIDKAGNLWGGIHGGGVNRFDGNSITHYNTEQGLGSNNVMCLLEDSINLWIGTKPGGVTKYDGTSFTQFENFMHIQKDGARVAVFSMLKDSKGNIWLGTNEGLEKYDGKNFMHFGIAQGLSWKSITSICEDKKGNLWLGTEYDSIVNKLDLSAAENGRYVFTHYNINPGLVSSINCIKEDKQNNLWFGSSNAGVVKFDRKTFTRYTTAQGLSNNSVNSIVEDNDENMWFLTSNGLCKMRTRQRNGEREIPGQTPGTLFTNYLNADGFLGVGSHYNSLFLEPNGNIWAGAENYITCYHPERDIPDTIPPQIHMSGISLFGENMNWTDLRKKKDSVIILGNGVAIHDFKFGELSNWYNVPEDLDLLYNNNYLTFQFVGIDINKPRHVRYQYMLEGLDNNWSSITENAYATYNNLPHGSYTFRVKAVNSDGHWSNELRYPFNIRPPWWKTWWFRITAGLLIVVAFYGIIRWSLHQKFKLQLDRSEKVTQLAELQQQKAELEMQALRAQMNPHFIFNCLSSINRFILKNEPDTASDYLTKFSRLIRMVLNNSRKTAILLEDELEMLRLYLDLERLRFKNAFDYSITFYNNFDAASVFIPPLLLQPFAENAIWHGLMHKAGKGHLEIAFALDDNTLNCFIMDDGVGRKNAEALKSKSAESQKSMGMQITAQRIALLNRNMKQTFFEIEDLFNKNGEATGTKVTLKIRYMESMKEFSDQT
jgi:ligand-binding sensor domain-containing protein/anti-sigma regulatory factor (Ser/Thr protein kinase)